MPEGKLKWGPETLRLSTGEMDTRCLGEDRRWKQSLLRLIQWLIHVLLKATRSLFPWIRVPAADAPEAKQGVQTPDVSFRGSSVSGMQVVLPCSFRQNRFNPCVPEPPCKLSQGSARQDNWEFTSEQHCCLKPESHGGWGWGYSPSTFTVAQLSRLKAN